MLLLCWFFKLLQLTPHFWRCKRILLGVVCWQLLDQSMSISTSDTTPHTTKYMYRFLSHSIMGIATFLLAWSLHFSIKIKAWQLPLFSYWAVDANAVLIRFILLCDQFVLLRDQLVELRSIYSNEFLKELVMGLTIGYLDLSQWIGAWLKVA